MADRKYAKQCCLRRRIYQDFQIRFLAIFAEKNTTKHARIGGVVQPHNAVNVATVNFHYF